MSLPACALGTGGTSPGTRPTNQRRALGHLRRFGAHSIGSWQRSGRSRHETGRLARSGARGGALLSPSSNEAYASVLGATGIRARSSHRLARRTMVLNPRPPVTAGSFALMSITTRARRPFTPRTAALWAFSACPSGSTRRGRTSSLPSGRTGSCRLLRSGAVRRRGPGTLDLL